MEKSDTTSVAWDYLSKLFNLCLIQPLDTSVGLRKTRFCKTHDLLRELCTGIPREYRCFFPDSDHLTDPALQRPWRRIAAPEKGIKDIPKSARCPSTLRTLRLSSNPKLANIPPNLFSHVKVMRVLDLSSTAITTLPESVGNMKLLKVLNLRNTSIAEIPECIRGLKDSLQLLDISKPDLAPPGPPIAVPDWIGDLRCFRHLSLHSHDSEASFSKSPRTLPNSLSKLTALVTLNLGPIYIDFHLENRFGIDTSRLQQMLQKWTMFKSLEKLSFSNDKNQLGIEGISRLSRLQELDLSIKYAELLDLEHLSTVDLRMLTVRGILPATSGRFEVVGFRHLQRLKELECENCWVFRDVFNSTSLEVLRLDCRVQYSPWSTPLEEMNLEDLQRMPKLKHLELLRSGTIPHFPYGFASSNRFPKLECLVIFEFANLRELPKLEEGCMRNLKELKVSGCPLLQRIPDGLERLPNLESLRVVNCGEMGERLEENNEDWHKMKANNNDVQITSDNA